MVLCCPAAFAIPEGPADNTPEFFAREATNYARTLEAAAEQANSLEFQTIWRAQDLINRAGWTDRATADPSWVGLPSGNTPDTPAGAQWGSVSSSDPTRYAEQAGPNGADFYVNEADVAEVVFYDFGCARVAGRIWAPKGWQSGDALLPGVVFKTARYKPHKPCIGGQLRLWYGPAM